MSRLKRKNRSFAHVQNDGITANFKICLSEGDPYLIVAALGDIARAHGMAQVAKDTGLSREYLSQILSDEGNPNFATIVKVVKALGLALHASSPTIGAAYSFTQAANINDAINKSGRQRMLSQRLAKCYLQIGQSIEAMRSKKILDASLALFDRQLVELKVFAPTQDNKAVLTNIEQAWISYKGVLVGRAPNRQDAKLILTFNEDILVMAQESTAQLEKLSGTAAGKVVNIAGRQRMLSQRMAKFYQAVNWGVAPQDTMSKLAAARKEFVDSLNLLAHFPNNTPDIQNQLELGRRQWGFFCDALGGRVAGTGNKALPATDVATSSERILEVMDTVTSLYTELA